MDKLLIKTRLEKVIKTSLDNLDHVNLSNTQKARAIALEINAQLDSLLNEDIPYRVSHKGDDHVGNCE